MTTATPRENTLRAMLEDTLDVLKDVESGMSNKNPRLASVQIQITSIEEVLTADKERDQTS